MKCAFIGLAVVASLLVVRPVPASPTHEQQLVDANNAFAFNLLKQLNAGQPAKNLFISPYSVSMVANRAVGQTKHEMAQVLGIQDMPDSSMNQAGASIHASFEAANTNLILDTANAIWIKKGVPVRPEFIALNRQYFHATVNSLDFANPRSMDIINAWARDHTRGLIHHIADEIDPAADDLFLANAVYFKGKWLSRFKPEDTADRVFHLRAAGISVPMMSLSQSFGYRCADGYQAVRLPYEDGRLAMYVFLPDVNSSPLNLLKTLSGDQWQRVIRPGFRKEDGDLSLPKFKLRYRCDLIPPLARMGMKSAFDSHAADLSGLAATKLFIRVPKQEAIVEVDEAGTEAAAVSVVIPAHGLGESPPDRFEMIVDRPFLFLIEDNRTGSILFMGLVFDPKTD